MHDTKRIRIDVTNENLSFNTSKDHNLHLKYCYKLGTFVHGWLKRIAPIKQHNNIVYTAHFFNIFQLLNITDYWISLFIFTIRLNGLNYINFDTYTLNSLSYFRSDIAKFRQKSLVMWITGMMLFTCCEFCSRPLNWFLSLPAMRCSAGAMARSYWSTAARHSGSVYGLYCSGFWPANGENASPTRNSFCSELESRRNSCSCTPLIVLI